LNGNSDAGLASDGSAKLNSSSSAQSMSVSSSTVASSASLMTRSESPAGNGNGGGSGGGSGGGVGLASAEGSTTSLADALEIDESDTFQFLWTIFAHVLNESEPIDVQLLVRTPSGTDRKIFGKLSDCDVKMGLPAVKRRQSAAQRAARLATPRQHPPLSPDMLSPGEPDLLKALESIDIDDIRFNSPPSSSSGMYHTMHF
jgi:hypothetical protein